MVCHVAGNYGTAFKAGHRTQGGPLSAKLFNILVDAVVREWVWQLKKDGDYKEGKLAALTATFFAIFYVDNAYLASQDAGFLQHVLALLFNLFQQVGLQTNTSKMQTMICTPGRIWTQLPTKSYCWMQWDRVTAAEWNSCDVQCYQCGKEMKAGSLGHHLADVQDIYQQTVVTEDLLEDRPPATFTANAGLHGRDLPCPFPGCEGQLWDGWMMWQHFRDVHPLDLVVVPKEGKYDLCERCGVQVNPLYPHHRLLKECQVGVEQK
jgi:hypothetical protein